MSLLQPRTEAVAFAGASVSPSAFTPRKAASQGASVCRSSVPSMRTGGRKKGGSQRPGPSRTPRDKREALERVAGEFGVFKARPGQRLDEKFTGPAAERATPAKLPFLPPGYRELEDTVGRGRLEVMEKGLFFTLAGLFAAFLGSGLAISSLAFFKATAKPPPPGFDDFVTNNLQAFFTPSLVVFFALSSVYGLYKQAQLKSGATGYIEINERDDRKPSSKER
jgi:hypothetical protein